MIGYNNKNKDINSAISLLSQIHSMTAEFLISKLKENGFKEFASSHGNILFQLKKNGSMSMGDLADAINRDRSTTTVLTRKLEKAGLVSMQNNCADKRVRTIVLTEKGAKYNEITANISNELLSTFYKDFTDEEKEQFLNFLIRIEKNFSTQSK